MARSGGGSRGGGCGLTRGDGQPEDRQVAMGAAFRSGLAKLEEAVGGERGQVSKSDELIRGRYRKKV